MTRRPGGQTVHVHSTRSGPFDMFERADIYPQIRAGVLSGETDIDIAIRVGISERTVARYRRRHGYTNSRGI